MNQNIECEKVSESLKYFLSSLKTSFWSSQANEKTVDSSFKLALELEEILLQKDKNLLIEEILKCYPNLNFEKPVDLLMQKILQNYHLSEHLMLYAVEKYKLLFNNSDFSKLLNEILSGIEFRGQIFRLIEEFPDVDLDFYRLNNFLSDLLSSSDLKFQVINSLKSQTSVFLKATKHSTVMNGLVMIDEMISCLEAQTDLRLWFLIMKNENLSIVLDLCAQHENFLKEVLKFFDKFADETESNYDEDLNVIYSHVNLDFEDFIKILQLFLNKKGIGKIVNEYLQSKSLTDKNFLFWVDVKACLEKNIFL